MRGGREKKKRAEVLVETIVLITSDKSRKNRRKWRNYNKWKGEKIKITKEEEGNGRDGEPRSKERKKK